MESQLESGINLNTIDVLEIEESNDSCAENTATEQAIHYVHKPEEAICQLE